MKLSLNKQPSLAIDKLLGVTKVEPTAIESPSGIQIVDLRLSSWVDAACQLAGGDLTRSEWARFLPNSPFRSTCPR